MDQDRAEFEKLLTGYLEGSLSTADRARLRDLLENHVEFREGLLKEVHLDEVLRMVVREAPKEMNDPRSEFVESVMREWAKTLPAGEPEIEVLPPAGSPVRRSTGRSAKSTRRMLRVRSDGGWKLAMGAVAALAVIAFIVFASSKPSAPPRKETPIVRPRTEPVAPRESEPTVDVPLRPEEKPKEIPLRVEPAPKPPENERPNRPLEEEKKRPETVQPRVEPAPPPKTPNPVQETRVVVAQLERIEGQVFVVTGGERGAAQAGTDLAAGQGLEVGAGSLAVLKYADGTRVEFGAETAATDLRAQGGKRITVARGSLLAVVAKQEHPMIVASAHGEAKILGTTLRINVDPDPKRGMRLEVEEGKVELKRLTDLKTVLVESGHFAVAAAGVELKRTPLPIEEIVLLMPTDERKLKAAGNEWRLVKSPKSPNGVALESGPVKRLTGTISQIPSFVTMTFEADAGRDYSVWVRGETLGTAFPLRLSQDAVLLQFGRAEVTPRHRPGVDFSTAPDGGLFGGWGYFNEPTWSGGDGDFFSAVGARLPSTTAVGAVRGDEPPTVVRFARQGAQILKLCVAEGPVRVDAILLSTTQKTRPAVDRIGPVRK